MCPPAVVLGGSAERQARGGRTKVKARASARARWQAEQDEVLAAAAEVARRHEVPFDLRLVSGFDVETILATADEIDAELIAIGSNRHSTLGTAFLGSVSKELLTQARRPVLVVHPSPVPAAAAV